MNHSGTWWMEKEHFHLGYLWRWGWCSRCRACIYPGGLKACPVLLLGHLDHRQCWYLSPIRDDFYDDYWPLKMDSWIHSVQTPDEIFDLYFVRTTWKQMTIFRTSHLTRFFLLHQKKLVKSMIDLTTSSYLRRRRFWSKCVDRADRNVCELTVPSSPANLKTLCTRKDPRYTTKSRGEQELTGSRSRGDSASTSSLSFMPREAFSLTFEPMAASRIRFMTFWCWWKWLKKASNSE